MLWWTRRRARQLTSSKTSGTTLDSSHSGRATSRKRCARRRKRCSRSRPIAGASTPTPRQPTPSAAGWDTRSSASRRCALPHRAAPHRTAPTRLARPPARRPQIGAYLDDPAGPEYVELHDAYKRAFDLCADFNSAVAAQASALDAPAATLGELMAHGAAVAGFASSASSEAQLLAVEFGNQTAVLVASLPRTNWPLLVAIGAFLAPLLVVPIALMFAPCMLAHGSRTGALAVQCVGFSWVVACILSFVYLMLGAISYVVGKTLFDVIGFGYTVPVAFVETFNNTIVCGGRVPDRLTFEEVRRSAPGRAHPPCGLINPLLTTTITRARSSPRARRCSST